MQASHEGWDLIYGYHFRHHDYESKFVDTFETGLNSFSVPDEETVLNLLFHYNS
jgi:hypothetical protein